MIKRVEDVLNEILKFNISKTTLDRFTIFIIYISMFFMIIPKYVIDITGSSIGEDIFNSIYFIFLIPYLYIFIHNIKHKYFKFSLDVILIFIYLLFVILSVCFSFNPFNSIIGSHGRRDGLLTLIMYILIYFDSRNIKDKNDVVKIIKIFIIYAIISTMHSFIQVYLPSNIFTIKQYGHMGYGFQGNPNFFGTYTMLFTLLSLFMMLFIIDNNFFKVSTIILFMGLVMAESSGPFFTFVLLFIGLIIYILIKRKDLIKKVMIWLIIFVSLFCIVNYSLIYINKNIYGVKVEDHYTISDDIKSVVDVLKNRFSKNNIEPDELYYQTDRIFSSRLSVSDVVIDYIKKDNHIWFGSGIDALYIYNLASMEDGNYYYWTVDKAHNIYLNMIAETGIFSFIVYLSWMIIVIVYGIKSKNKYVYLLLFGLIGYNIQGIFNINVIYVMPYYYILTGMMIGLIEGDRHESRKY